MAFEGSLLSVAGTGGGHEALHEDEAAALLENGGACPS